MTETLPKPKKWPKYPLNIKKKMTVIPLEPKKRPKYPRNLNMTKITMKSKKWSKYPSKPKNWTKYLINLKNDWGCFGLGGILVTFKVSGYFGHF